MNRTIAKYKLTLFTVATFSSMSICSPSIAIAVQEAESGGTISSAPGSGHNHTAVSQAKQPVSRAIRTARKPIKMRYGNLMRSKPVDSSNFGLLKSYCSHSHGKRWNSK